MSFSNNFKHFVFNHKPLVKPYKSFQVRIIDQISIQPIYNINRNKQRFYNSLKKNKYSLKKLKNTLLNNIELKS